MTTKTKADQLLWQIHWQRLEALKLVKLDCEPDELAYLEDLICSCGDTDCETTHQVEDKENIEKYGVWVISGKYTLAPGKTSKWKNADDNTKWEYADSVGGFVGSYNDTGLHDYDNDMKQAAVTSWRWSVARRHHAQKLRAPLTESTLEIYGLKNPYKVWNS